MSPYLIRGNWVQLVLGVSSTRPASTVVGSIKHKWKMFPKPGLHFLLAILPSARQCDKDISSSDIVVHGMNNLEMHQRIMKGKAEPFTSQGQSRCRPQFPWEPRSTMSWDQAPTGTEGDCKYGL